MGEGSMELIAADLRAAQEMFGVLEKAAAVENVHDVTVQFRLDGGDWITVGYGQQAEPAIVAITHGGDEHG